MHLLNKPIVEARGLSWLPKGAQPSGRSSGLSADVALLSNISFSLLQGERVLLTGPSGAGKSTLLHAIANVLQQTEVGAFSGELYVRGRSALVSQDPANSFVAAKLGGEVAFGPENLAVPENQIRADANALLTSVGIGYGVHRPTVELSGGESQRLQLAGALAMKPELLLLDEPLSMLDPEAAANVLSAIKAALAAAPQTSAIVVDHDATAWRDVVSRVLTIGAEGRLLSDETIAEFANRSQPKPQPLPFSLGFSGEETGRIKAIVGASGAGKTTALVSQLAKLSPREVGWVPQQPEQTIVSNTVLESATATVKNLGMADETALHLLRHLGLADQLQQNPHLLSGGELRRLALVSALAHHPRYLLLDEPTVGQDAQTWAVVAGVIVAAREAGVQVVVATHDERIIALADEVTRLEHLAQVPNEPAKRGSIPPLVALGVSIGLLAGSLMLRGLADALIALAVVVVALLASLKWLPPQNPKRFVPVMFALASIWLANGVFAAGGITPAGFENAGFVAARVAFFALPSVALAAALEPTQLAAALAKWLRVPARPAVVAAAALVRLEQVGWIWADVRQTRRLRGFSLRRGPIARTKEFAATLFAVLVQALRSAADLAVAMQARGLAEPSAKRRTWVKF